MNTALFWKAVLDQEAETLRKYFHKDAVIKWHCTNEQFSAEEYIRANCEYPGEWDGEIERTETAGDMIVTVVRVFPRDQSASWHVVSFLRLKEGLITEMDEYWSDDGEPPVWRKKMGIGRPIL